MGRKYARISDLKSGTKVEACFLLQNFQLRPKKDGSNFVTMVLRDATGKITGIMWDNFDSLASGSIRENDFVEVSGDVLTYNSQLQFKVNRIVRVNDSEIDATYFLPTCPVPAAQLEKDLRSLIEQITDKDLKQLVNAIFGNRAFIERFRRAPSAVSMHQAYIGGLMEHTICVVKNALRIADNYPAANRSLLIAAGLLHDIGKTMEFVYDKKIAYSDVGRLLGHISIGNAMVECECCRIEDFPLSKKVLVQHIILSHHGLLEYGSPKRPKTLEALIIHHADHLDAQLSNYLEYAANSERTGTRWEYSNMFERYLFSPSVEIEGCELFREISYRPSHTADLHQQMSTAVPSDQLMNEPAEADLSRK
jgi:3'-5' exoribonuclease